MDNRIVISLSKKKSLIALIGALAFVVIGFCAAIAPSDFVFSMMRSTEIIRIFGIASIVFFGFCSLYIIRKLYDKKPGLIIDEYGITDNTNAMSIGLIEWNDIIGVERKQVMSTSFLILHINNTSKYIQRAKNIVVKRALEMNVKTYGSPIAIISNSLRMSFDDLEKLIKSEIEKRR